MFKIEGLTTLELKSPQAGEQIRMPLNVQARRSLSGKRRVWRMGTAKKVISFNFANLNIPERRIVENFVVANRGQLVTVTDHFDIRWIGFLVEDVTFTHVGRHDNQFTLTMELVQQA